MFLLLQLLRGAQQLQQQYNIKYRSAEGS